MENIGAFNFSNISELKKKYSPYLVEVRKRLVFTVSTFIIATIFGFLFNEQIIKFLVERLSLKGVNIVFTSPFQFINLAITCGVVTGVVVTFPLLVFQIIYFLKPALKRKEFKLFSRFLPFSFILFVLGFAFGSVIMKWQIEIFLNRSLSLGIGNILDISSLLSVVFLTSALLGLGFQFPIVLLILLRLGVLKSKQLSSKRHWVYLGSFVFTLFLPPDSIIADLVLSLPLIILFELTLLLNWIFEK